MRADSLPPPTRRAQPRTLFRRVSCGALLLAVAANALSLTSRRFVGRYDFGYAIRGDKPARPAQVFDDGSGKVYFQARADQTLPAVFVGKEMTLLVLQPEGQYFTARTSASEFTLVLGEARASVQRGDTALGGELITVREPGARLLASAEGGLTPGVDYGAPLEDAAAGRVTHEQPVVFARASAALRPEALDALSALVVRIGHATAITVTGRNDAGGVDALATARAEALRNALLARGVAASDIELSGAEGSMDEAHPRASTLRWSNLVQGDPRAAQEETVTSFDIAPTDRDIATALRRWARASGYEVVWDVRWVAPVNGALRVEAPSFLDAVGQVVTGLRAQGYPVQARTYTDHVVRFTSAE